MGTAENQKTYAFLKGPELLHQLIVAHITTAPPLPNLQIFSEIREPDFVAKSYF